MDIKMKILLITGSAHRDGTTACLAEQFCKGALAAGHELYRFDAAFKNVHPCIACGKCHNDGNGCTFKDDMELLNLRLLEAEVIVFVSPIYYYAISAQLKTVIDRFYANDADIHGSKKAVLLAAMADDQAKSADGAVMSFKNMAEYLGWQIAGIVIAKGCSDRESLRSTDYPGAVYELGKYL